MVATQGFGSMSPERRREIAAKGGKAAHEMGLAHKWTRDEAVEAGRKGGSVKGYKRSKKNAEEMV